MTYRRDSSDFGVIVRHAQERHADTSMRHAMTDASMSGLQHARPHSPVPAARDDVGFGVPQRRVRVFAAAPDEASLETPPTPGSEPDVILVKSGFRQVATRVREIVYVESARNYVRIHLETGAVFKSRVPIDRLALHLGRERFMRVHRGCLVNVDRIRSVTPVLGGRLLLTLSDGARVMVARDRRRFVLSEISAASSPRS
jgi:DNA-binding LytR/AlgR family response regulator